MARRTAIFLINLVQDVNIVRPLVFMAARDFGFRVRFLVSTKFEGRDLFGIWQAELDHLCSETGAELEYFESDWEARQHLDGEGLIFAASESHLPNHVTTHSVFRYAPPTFLKVTLQHGFECVGFRHSAEHSLAHGETASFGADIVCSWYGPDQLTAMASSQLNKLWVTGPTTCLQMPETQVSRDRKASGIICENLHSVRMRGSRDLRPQFVTAFSDFCRAMEKKRRSVVLRPHPGGQYLVKNKVELPKNARMTNAPMYRLDLRQFAYGISAPSSVLIDMLLAGIPTAVWQDRDGDLDTGAYRGLTSVSSPDEWFDFATAATSDPEPFLTRQRDFLSNSGMLLDPEKIYTRYAEIFRAAERMQIRPHFTAERERILLIGNARVPTLQLSFEKPLEALVARGEYSLETLTERELQTSSPSIDRVEPILSAIDPTIIVFCRYSGPGSDRVVDWARRNAVPVIYHIDDDLLAIPPNIGAAKFAVHNDPERLAAVRYLLTSADLVYASTDRLRSRLLEYFPDISVISGRIYCSGRVLRPASDKAPCIVGYMASADHAHNLDIVLPAIERLLDDNDNVRFELFGSVPKPAELDRFGDRVASTGPVADYSDFLTALARRRWSIGICPLVPIGFNLMKANTKWVEYTSVGAAVVASAGTVYDDCCAGGCGLLADTAGEWFDALNLLVKQSDARLAMIERAQDKLREEYNVGVLREQLLAVFERARDVVRAGAQSEHGEKALV